MEISDLVPLGEKILDIGNKLKELRLQRDSVTSQIATLETELAPLLIEHAKIIAEVAGTPAATAPPAPPYNPGGPPPPGPPGPGGPVDEKVIRTRVLKYLEDAEPGVSALDVANALRLDSAAVRKVMADLMLGR